MFAAQSSKLTNNNMSRISIELVPRDTAKLKQELQEIATHFPMVDLVNIPDLLRFDIRSWQGCAIAKQYVPHTIPHLRAIDFANDEPFPLASYFREFGIDEVLVVTGDPPPADSRRPNGATAIELIGLIREALPDINIYAAIDPYRQGIQQEIEYAMAKQAAGVDGFFTQPFFDTRLMEIFWEQLPDFNIYWGISPVLTARSQRYWTSRNRAVFPSNFEPTMAWNQAFGREAMRFARQTGSNAYFMPIRTDLVSYLNGVLIHDDMPVNAAVEMGVPSYAVGS